MGIWTQLGDTAGEKLFPSGIKESDKLGIFATRNVAQQEVLPVSVENNLNGVGIIGILRLAFETERLANLKIIPNKICIVISASCPTDRVHQPYILLE